MNYLIKQTSLYGLAAITVFLCCFWLDFKFSHTHDLKDYLNSHYLKTLIIYFVPIMAICSFLFEYLQLRYKKIKSLFLSLLSGIPLGFILVFSLLRSV